MYTGVICFDLLIDISTLPYLYNMIYTLRASVQADGRTGQGLVLALALPSCRVEFRIYPANERVLL